MHARLLVARLLAAILVWLVATPVVAQLTDASLKGLVRTAAGTPVGGSTVTVTLTATGQSRTTTTTAEGTFLLQGLTPGEYMLLVEATGVQPVGQSDLRLASGATVDVTVDLPEATRPMRWWSPRGRPRRRSSPGWCGPGSPCTRPAAAAPTSRTCSPG